MLKNLYMSIFSYEEVYFKIVGFRIVFLIIFYFDQFRFSLDYRIYRLGFQKTNGIIEVR